MSTASGSPKKSVAFWIRVSVLGVVLVAAAGLFAVDRSARNGAQEAYDKLQAKVPSEEDDSGPAVATPTQAEVRALFGREPDAPATTSGVEAIETYSWSAGFRSYSVYVVYGAGPERRVLRATLNTPPTP